MTSTDIFSGMSAHRPSSRVLAPPGGGSSNIFGEPSYLSNAKHAGEQKLESVAEASHDSHLTQAAGTPSVHAAPVPQDGVRRNPITGDVFHARAPPVSLSVEAGAGGSIISGGGNMSNASSAVPNSHSVDGYDYHAPYVAPGVAAAPASAPVPQQHQQLAKNNITSTSPAQAAPTPSIRVRQPPGGRSSNIFG